MVLVRVDVDKKIFEMLLLTRDGTKNSKVYQFNNSNLFKFKEIDSDSLSGAAILSKQIPVRIFFIQSTVCYQSGKIHLHFNTTCIVQVIIRLWLVGTY